uniref:Globin family profile domain-containing protein n=1 Tax=Parascaris univalens TaxID=6257 RepID=A0A915ACM5_PARUN
HQRMGNSHGSTHSNTKKRRLSELRRLSAPNCQDRQRNHASFLLDSTSKQTASVDESNIRPKIQVNGQESIDEALPLPACSSNAAERRMKFLNSSSRVAMRSLEEGVDGGVELVMRPLKDRARSLSPLKQLRTYSFRSTPSEESFLNDVQQRCIRRSWCSVMQRLSRERHEFGFFVLARVFNRASYLKRAFGAEEYKSIDDIPPDHPVHRHSRIFTKLIDLTVRNVDELDSEIAPAIFRYGQRHYHSNAVSILLIDMSIEQLLSL